MSTICGHDREALAYVLHFALDWSSITNKYPGLGDSDKYYNARMALRDYDMLTQMLTELGKECIRGYTLSQYTDAYGPWIRLERSSSGIGWIFGKVAARALLRRWLTNPDSAQEHLDRCFDTGRFVMVGRYFEDEVPEGRLCI